MNQDAVTEAEVRHVASLARIDLEDSEIERYVDQFGEILAAFETLDEVPEVDAEPALSNVLRSDEIREGLTQEEALGNAPDRDDGYFKGPSVS